MATMATIKRHARRLGLEIDDAVHGRCRRVNVDCPPGKMLEPGLHHFHAEWLDGDGSDRRAAMDDLDGRLSRLDVLLVCDDPECDWCNDF